MRRLLAALVTLFATIPALAQLITITPAAPGPWTFNASASANPAPPAAYIAPGFETPPLGIGSAHLTPGSDGALNAQVRNTAFAGTRLDSITALSYSTYVDVDGSGGQAPFMNLLIDQDGDGVSDDQLFFEPAYQTGSYPGDPVPNQGAIQLRTWQTWDALVGGWWSLDAGTFGPPLVTLASYISMFPNATIVNTAGGLGGLRIITGTGAGAWNNFLGATDNVTIDTTAIVPITYDFEPLAGNVITVTTADLDGWTLQTVDDGDATNTATVSIVTGPGTPPMGDGSLQLSVGADGGDAAQARNNTYDGMLLRDLTSLLYYTYVQTPGSGGQAPYIILNVDYDGNGTSDDFLFFEPVYQTAGFFPENPQPAIAVGTWQQWDAANGGWWSVNNTAGAGPGVNVKPLAAILDVEPDARLATDTAGAVRIVAGFGAGAWDNFLGNADALAISFASPTTTYNFEPVPSITIADVSQAEGSGGGTTNFVFNLTLSEPVSQTVTVDYTTADNTALAADGDYTPVTVAQTATFAPGTTSTTITIVVAADNKFEPNEDFFVNLANPQFATLADTQAVSTILNDDPVPSMAINDPSVAEGNAGNTPLSFNVILLNPSSQTITVDYTITGNTATAGTDFTAVNGTLTFVPNDVSENIVVQVLGDTFFENDETLTVTLSNPMNATIMDGTGVGTILNDDAAPAISIADNSVTEGNAGTTPLTFDVTLANPSSFPVTVDYTITGNTATPGVDFTSANGTLTFAPGDTSETITVQVVGDTIDETNETLTVTLSNNSVNSTIADGTATGTILDDDGAPTITIDDVTLAEGNAGTTAFTFTVTLSNLSATPVTVDFATANGTAAAGSDYNATSGTVTINPGSLTGTITVNVIGDVAFEPNETFFVNLTNPTNATIADAQGTGTITNDDGAPVITINDVTQAEGNAGTTPFTFTVTLSNLSGVPVTVDFATADGTATAVADYNATSGTLTINPGSLTGTITVNVIGEVAFEPNETFFVNLTNPTNATIADAQGLGTITNDDGPVADLSITKSGTPGVRPGGLIQYTITVANAGPQSASNVVVTDVLPAGTTFVSATPSQGTCSGTSIVTCTLGALGVGASATIQLNITAPMAEGTITNTATVSNTPESDPTPANNAGTTGTAVLESIPTLSEWGVLALIAALMGLALVKMK